MFGKHFASMYTGSMFGKPALVFAVLGYVIATMRPNRKDGECYVELNPTLLAATFASKPEEVLDAVRDLTSPDERSRSEGEEGRRLIPLGNLHTGPMQFKVVNGAKYRAIRDEEERRAYLREAKRRERAVNKNVDSQPRSTKRQPRSTQVEVEAEVEGSQRPPSAVGDGSLREGGPKKNPLMAEVGGRAKAELELLRLVRREADLTDKDPVEVMADVSHYEGARRSAINPASMSDDRLLNSVLDARERVKALEAREEKRGRHKGR